MSQPIDLGAQETSPAATIGQVLGQRRINSPVFLVKKVLRILFIQQLSHFLLAFVILLLQFLVNILPQILNNHILPLQQLYLLYSLKIPYPPIKLLLKRSLLIK